MNKTVLSLAPGTTLPWLAGTADAQEASARAPAEEPRERSRSLGVVTVAGGRPTSLPTQIPTTIEGITGEDILARDVNGFACFGASRDITADPRVRCQIDRQWSAAFDIDHANNDPCWNFNPCPQRTFSAALRRHL